jgi:hypothetical protein
MEGHLFAHKNLSAALISMAQNENEYVESNQNEQ